MLQKEHPGDFGNIRDVQDIVCDLTILVPLTFMACRNRERRLAIKSNSGFVDSASDSKSSFDYKILGNSV